MSGILEGNLLSLTSDGRGLSSSEGGKEGGGGWSFLSIQWLNNGRHIHICNDGPESWTGNASGFNPEVSSAGINTSNIQKALKLLLKHEWIW